MSEADDVLGKLDALLKRHQAPSEPDIPVLTEVVVPSPLDLEAIPILTEEVIEYQLPPGEASSPAGEGAPEEPPFPELLPAVPAEASAPAPLPVLEFELPADARWVSLVETGAAPATEVPAETVPAETVPAAPAPAPEPGAPIAPGAGSPAAVERPPGEVPAAVPSVLSQETIQLIADTIKADVAKILDEQLQQALAQQLQTSLHVALDRALASMLDQFVIHIEEVVRVSIASELEKQLEQLRKSLP